jgi:glutathione S-transferase
MKLYTSANSANGGKPLAYARWRSIELEVEEVDVYRGAGRSADYLRLHPDGRIPTLVDGDFVLWESNAILLYLDELSGEAVRDARDQAEVARWLFFEASQWQPAMAAALGGHVAHRLGLGPPAAPDWDAEGFERALAVLRQQLDARPWLVADGPTIADLAVAAMGIYLAGLELPEKLQGVAGWIEGVLETSGWRSLLDGTPWARR